MQLYKVTLLQLKLSPVTDRNKNYVTVRVHLKLFTSGRKGTKNMSTVATEMNACLSNYAI